MKLRRRLSFQLFSELTNRMWFSVLYLTNRMWFSVVHSLIDNDTRHHSGQNLLQFEGSKFTAGRLHR